MFVPGDTTGALHARRVMMPEVNLTPSSFELPHPAARAPRIFADTAEIEEIRLLLESGIINGVTTNPTLLKRAGAKNWDHAKRIMADICTLLAPLPVSLELTELDKDKMIAQAEELGALGANSVIKVPVGGYTAIDKSLDPHTGLKVLRKLWERGIRTNATLIFNSAQAFWAANAGATYVSPFLGRLADYIYKNDAQEREPGNSLYWIEDHKNPEGAGGATHNTEYVASGGARKDAGIRLIREIAAIFANYNIQTEILAASFRNYSQVTEALLAGADILTVPSPLLQRVANHPLSDEGMKSFVEDSKVFAGS